MWQMYVFRFLISLKNKKNSPFVFAHFLVVYHFEFVPQISPICADKLYDSAAICVICGTLNFQTETRLHFSKVCTDGIIVVNKIEGIVFQTKNKTYVEQKRARRSGYKCK